MAVIRQFNWLGQQRVDVPHLRLVEAGVAGDFDALAGVIMAGQLATVIKGFDVVSTGAVGNDAAALVVNAAGGAVLHFLASEAGSVFVAPADRAPEVLAPTNPRVSGGFTPNTVNFVGVDLVRSTDDSTADTVQFLDADTDMETAGVVALARTLDYVFVVSATEFSATPGVLPLAKVTTDASNTVVLLEDARHLFFRLGAGGSAPAAVSPFGWPGGRNEADPALASVAGDRSLFSLKDWCNAVMTRLWEVGGGAYWYSPTADRNVRMVSATPFVSTGEPFEVVSGNLHWKGLKFVFDNSNGVVNEVNDQLTDVVGLTNLADGECVYVDVDRTLTRRIAFSNPLIPKKGALGTLGLPDRPGSRFVIAWKVDGAYFTRDQYLPIATTGTHAATTAANGLVKLSATPATPLTPVVATASQLGSTLMGMEGFTRLGTGTIGDLVIGNGLASGDKGIILNVDDPTATVTVHGNHRWSVLPRAVLTLSHDDSTSPYNGKLLGMGGVFGGSVLEIETGGAVGMASVKQPPIIENALSDIRSKLYVRKSRYWHTSAQVATNNDLPASTPSGPAGVGHVLTGGNVVLVIDGYTPAFGDRVVVKDTSAGLTAQDRGVYTVTQLGVAGTTPWKLTRATDADTGNELCENFAIKSQNGSVNSGLLWRQSAADPVVLGTTAIAFSSFSGFAEFKDQLVIRWVDGTINVIAESPIFLEV